MEQILESLSVLWVSPFKDELAGIMWCIFLAVVLVFVLTLRQQVTLGKIIRRIREKSATTPDRALPAKALGKLPASAVKGSNTLLAKVTDPDGTERYYLPEKNEKKADAVLKTASTPVWLALLELAALYLVLVVLYYLIPWMFSVL